MTKFIWAIDQNKQTSLIRKYWRKWTYHQLCLVLVNHSRAQQIHLMKWCKRRPLIYKIYLNIRVFANRNKSYDKWNRFIKNGTWVMDILKSKQKRIKFILNATSIGKRTCEISPLDGITPVQCYLCRVGLRCTIRCTKLYIFIIINMKNHIILSMFDGRIRCLNQQPGNSSVLAS